MVVAIVNCSLTADMMDDTSGELVETDPLEIFGDDEGLTAGGTTGGTIGGTIGVTTGGTVGVTTGGTIEGTTGGTIGATLSTATVRGNVVGGDGGMLEGRSNGIEVGIRVGDEGLVGNPVIFNGIVTGSSFVGADVRTDVGTDVRTTLTGLVTGLVCPTLGILSGGGPGSMMGDGGFLTTLSIILMRGDDLLIVLRGLGELGDWIAVDIIGTTLALPTG
jgi:hypothetical protein